MSAAPENVRLEITRQPLKEFVFIQTPIDQFSGEEEIHPVDVIPNKYYYAVTREVKPRLFIIYIINNNAGYKGRLTYNIVYIRDDDNRWIKTTKQRDIRIKHDNIASNMDMSRINMFKEMRLTPPEITDKIGFKIYNIPDLNQNDVSPPTFGYNGGRRKTRRSVKRRLRSKRSRRGCRK